MALQALHGFIYLSTVLPLHAHNSHGASGRTELSPSGRYRAVAHTLARIRGRTALAPVAEKRALSPGYPRPTGRASTLDSGWRWKAGGRGGVENKDPTHTENHHSHGTILRLGGDRRARACHRRHDQTGALAEKRRVSTPHAKTVEGGDPADHLTSRQTSHQWWSEAWRCGHPRQNPYPQQDPEHSRWSVPDPSACAPRRAGEPSPP